MFVMASDVQATATYWRMRLSSYSFILETPFVQRGCSLRCHAPRKSTFQNPAEGYGIGNRERTVCGTCFLLGRVLVCLECLKRGF
jgi:hypothetical protein